MNRPSRKQSFLGTRSGQGFLLFFGFSAVLSASLAYGFYAASLNWFKEHKSEEKITALQLVDAFVTNYSGIRGKMGPDAPVPAAFRAHSIALFDKMDGEGDDFRLRWVGREGRSIATPPDDPEMAKTIESFAAEHDPKPVSQFLTVKGALVFRTVYPSIAREQSCVDCHNEIQPDLHWKRNDLMGAFSIDVPAGPFIRNSIMQAAGLGAMLLLLGGIGLVVSLLHRRGIAEREVVQASLKESEERFRDFAESASDWLWEQDADLRFCYVSQGSPDEAGAGVIGKTRHDLMTEGKHFGITEEQRRAYEAAIGERRPFQNMRFQRIGRDGEVHHISVSGKPIVDADGSFRGYRGTGRDVTPEALVELELGRRVEERTAELRKAQGELLRKEKLSTLGQLTATVAHELRNPLSAIRNTVFAVKESLATSGLNLERPLSRVERNIQRCDRIITDLLDFTRMRELSRADVEADPWVDEVLNEQRLPQGVGMRRAFGAHGYRLSFDPERMRRVVINLLENAAQAMAEMPDGDGAERAITVSTSAEAGWFELVIADRGPGIPGDVLSKVFEPLFSTKSFGTGLGLPTVKQIVEQHGGTVEISSELGRGTCVVVRLPSTRVEELAA